VAAVVLDECILAAGGGTVQGLAPTAMVDCFVPPVPAAPAASAAALVGLAALLACAGSLLVAKRFAHQTTA
jgi:hypothetical protein